MVYCMYQPIPYYPFHALTTVYVSANKYTREGTAHGRKRNVSDADAPGRNRPGRRPKDQKRIPLSLRITPAMRSRLVALAEENGRSVSQQTEFLLELALAGGASQDLSPPSTDNALRVERKPE